MSDYPRFDLFFGIAYDESLIYESPEDFNIYEAAELQDEHVQADTFGYLEEPCLMVRIKASHLHGDWDAPTPITSELMQMMANSADHGTAGWADTLKAFCEKHNLPWQEPKWQVVCSYG